jgi:hypothetical protein
METVLIRVCILLVIRSPVERAGPKAINSNFVIPVIWVDAVLEVVFECQTILILVSLSSNNQRACLHLVFQHFPSLTI